MKIKNIIPLILSFTLISTAQASIFSDVVNNPNKEAIEFLYQNGIISGYDDGSFQPAKSINRAELLKILVEAKTETPKVEDYNNCFPDVKNEWFAPYICYAKSQKWIEGYPDGSFRPGLLVNKAEAIKMLINTQNIPIDTINGWVFDDIDNNEWYAPFIQTAKNKGLISTSNFIYGIGNYMSRGEISENLFRSLIIKRDNLSSFSEFQPSTNHNESNTVNNNFNESTYQNSNIPSQPTSSPQKEYYFVEKVVDGDTIKVQKDGITQTIRMIGIDTPETVSPSKPVQCFGQEASNMTKSKLLNKNVYLESDPTQGNLDKYNRLLRYVFLEDQTNFNLWMVANGYAFEYTYNIPYKYQSEFKAAQANARDQGLGLWNENSCNGVNSPINQSNDNQQNTSYKFYVSSQAKSKYYCETDSAWKNLSPKNLLIYDDEASLLKDFPKLTLNKPC